MIIFEAEFFRKRRSTFFLPFKDRGDVKKNKLIIAISLVIIVVFLFPAIAVSANIDPETIVTGKCTACHMADRIREARKNVAEWTELVDKEIDRGADLDLDEREAVIDWLADKYGKTEVAQTEPVTEQSQVEVAQAESDTSTLPFTSQAETGVEFWQLVLSGGMLISGGAWLRRS